MQVGQVGVGGLVGRLVGRLGGQGWCVGKVGVVRGQLRSQIRQVSKVSRTGTHPPEQSRRQGKAVPHFWQREEFGILGAGFMVQETSPRSSCILAIKYYVAVEIIYYWLAGYSESRRGNLFHEGATNTQKYFQPQHHYKTFQLTQADPSQPQTEHKVPNREFKQCSNLKKLFLIWLSVNLTGHWFKQQLNTSQVLRDHYQFTKDNYNIIEEKYLVKHILPSLTI